MSMYRDYCKEREGAEVVEYPYGFYTYRINGSTMYVSDVYIVPAHRDDGVTVWDLLNEILVVSAQHGCTHIMGSVNPKANNADDSIKVLHAAGFKVCGCDVNLIYFARPTVMEGDT